MGWRGSPEDLTTSFVPPPRSARIPPIFVAGEHLVSKAEGDALPAPFSVALERAAQLVPKAEHADEDEAAAAAATTTANGAKKWVPGCCNNVLLDG